MAKKIKHLKKEQLAALELFHQFELGNNFKTKKAKYEEISSRLKQKVKTVETWIIRWNKEYLAYLEELQIADKKLQKNFTLEGLTKKQEIYIHSRIMGKSQKESKLKAGYSPNTDPSKIENHPLVVKSMADVRRSLLNDLKLGPMAVLNDLLDIRNRAKIGIDEVRIVEEHGPDGKKHTREVKKIKHVGIELQATSKIANILGYDSFAPEQIELKKKELKEIKKNNKENQRIAKEKVNIDKENGNTGKGIEDMSEEERTNLLKKYAGA